MFLYKTKRWVKGGAYFFLEWMSGLVMDVRVGNGCQGW